MTRLTKLFRYALPVILLVAFLAPGATPAMASTSNAANCTYYHTVRWGETLFGIGLAYGVDYRYLAQVNGIANPSRIYAGQTLCVPYGYGKGGYYPPYYGGYPNIYITSVVPMKTVTFRAYNLPANDTFNVIIGTYGSLGLNGAVAGQLSSAQGGANVTFNIPAQYADRYRLSIRIQSPTSGYYAYNWFYNNTTPVPQPQPQPMPGQCTQVWANGVCLYKSCPYPPFQLPCY